MIVVVILFLYSDLVAGFMCVCVCAHACAHVCACEC